MLRVRVVPLLLPVLLLACTGAHDPSISATPSSPFTADAGAQLTVAMLRHAELRRNDQTGMRDDDPTQALAPTQGDVFGLGGNLLGDAAGGLPGGAALGFGGQVAGGNKLGKAMGSTVGGLLGAALGPLGGVAGSVVGGFVGRQMQQAAADEQTSHELGPIYIDGMDTGPLAAASPDAT